MSSIYPILLASACLLVISNATAQTLKPYRVAVQPIQDAAATRKAFQPLIDYLSAKTGAKFILVTPPNFLVHASNQSNPGYADFILDAAHFTGYRCQQNQFTVLAKIDGEVSYSLVARNDSDVVDADDLVGKRLSLLSAPSIASVRLAQMFPNFLRQPVLRSADSAQQAIDSLLSGDVDSALVPTPMVAGRDQLQLIEQSESNPHMALSASSNVPKTLQAQVQQALTGLKDDPGGSNIRDGLHMPPFKASSCDEYLPYASLLLRYWQTNRPARR